MSLPVLICGKSGSGKGQPKTDIIPTPDGDKVFGDLQVGDKVFGSSGQPVTVTKVHDRGIIPTYKVVFSDGATKLVDGEHVWTLERIRTEYDNKKTIRNIKTKDLEGQALDHYYLPMTAVEYEEKAFAIDPYLLGLWLADGSVHHSNVRITKKDARIVEYLKPLASKYKDYGEGVYQFDFSSNNPNINRGLLNSYGFDNLTRSRQKAIPSDYLLGSIRQRRELLRGLMDGDGSYPHTNREGEQAELYSTTSVSLAKTVHRLITSLGIVARDRHIVDHREGKTDYYQVSFNEGSRYNKRSIKTVIRVDDQDIQCIEVDDERSLYVCDTYNHLLTHNSTSMRNFAHDEIALINVARKALPFKGKFDSQMDTDNYETIKKGLAQTQKKSIVIDDAGYLITNFFMKNHSLNKQGGAVYALYNQLADDFWNLIEWCKTRLPEDKIVYFIMHEDKNEFGDVKPKTIGKLLDDKVCVEGLFTIVFRAISEGGEYKFRTHTDGLDVAKTPVGMFETDEVPNDLKEIDKKIREFYELAPLTDKKGE